FALSLSSSAGADSPEFQQISPAGGFDGIQFEHLAMNAGGKFVAVSRSQVYVGDATAGTVRKVLDNSHLGFVLEDLSSQTSQNQSHRLTLDILGTRLAINAAGDYVIASNTTLFAGNVDTGEPRKMYENPDATFQQVALNDAGHFVALTGRKLLAGKVQASAAAQLAEDAPGGFLAYSVDGVNGDWGVEVGESHLALNGTGQFVATSAHAVYAGSVPAASARKLFEDSHTGFRHVAISEAGVFTVVSVRNVYRGVLAGSKVASFDALHAMKALYRCPMDREVTSDKPGKCPKCGMTLELQHS
ncbi:MAG: hypothetical protein HY303_09520, partial [Candidatus Wallbacteria bacterium]|nr:hypothetical protein [Candidatus Wallbacteria bacterium]